MQSLVFKGSFYIKKSKERKISQSVLNFKHVMPKEIGLSQLKISFCLKDKILVQTFNYVTLTQFSFFGQEAFVVTLSAE